LVVWRSPPEGITRQRRVQFRTESEAGPREAAAVAGVPIRTDNDGGTTIMGRYLLLWLLGIPLPILLLIWLFGGLH
jgi:hypothetical protein